MLDGSHRHVVPGQHGLPFDPGYAAHLAGNLRVTFEIHTAEHVSRVGLRGEQGGPDGLARVQTGPLQGDRSRKCALPSRV